MLLLLLLDNISYNHHRLMQYYAHTYLRSNIPSSSLLLLLTWPEQLYGKQNEHHYFKYFSKHVGYFIKTSGGHYVGVIKVLKKTMLCTCKSLKYMNSLNFIRFLHGKVLKSYQGNFLNSWEWLTLNVAKTKKVELKRRWRNWFRSTTYIGIYLAKTFSFWVS